MHHARHFRRLLSLVFLAAVVTLAAASCGGGNGNNVFDGGIQPSGGFSNDASLTSETGLLTGGTVVTCHPKSCQDQGFTCGVNGDGCGGSTGDCGKCVAPEFCGGGGRSRCGTTPGGGVDAGSDASACKPKTCADWGFTCGPTGDGCSTTNILQCGTCSAPQYCGGNPSQPGTCGGDLTKPLDAGPDGGGSLCVPTTCAALGFDCGYAADGCGGLLDCTSASSPCTAPKFCGGAGPNKCGGNSGVNADGGPASACTPSSCAALGYNCGPAGDGCGGVLDCSAAGPCLPPKFCGGGGPSVCGGNVNALPDGAPITLCVPTACPAGSCGQMSDGCGNLVTCPVTCTAPDTCGGGGTPYQCGHPCTNLCTQQVACAGGATTTLSGTVRAGTSAWVGSNATPDPVPNVLVYVPNAPLSPLGQGFTAGSCPSCTDDVSGSPLVSTYTDFDGTFTLTNVPVGANIPVVIQMGRWRRQFSFAVTGCQANVAGDLNLPQNQSQGSIPLTAISTGSVDALECVLLKMGIDQAEFTAEGGTGRIHVYGGGSGTLEPDGGPAGNPGVTVNGSQPERALMGTGGSYMQYDQLMFPCWGSKGVTKTADEYADLVTYADSGGHFFATHYSYTWLDTNGEFVNAANWHPDADNAGDVTWTLNVSPTVPPSPPAPHVGTFARWLNYVGALSNASAPAVPNPATVAIYEPRFDVDGVKAGSTAWITGNDQLRLRGKEPNPTYGDPLVEHFTFDTPVGGTAHCGHAIFSDFHVTNKASTYGMTFPGECDRNALTPQEKILEYMIWDLGACVTPPPPPVCNPLTCAQQHIACGPAGDGCGNTIASCGTCAPPLSCGGGGLSGQCGQPDGGACTPRTCAAQNIACGPAGDGCGGLTASCGSCPAGQTCGGAGVAGHCGAPDAGSCNPLDCAGQHIACGPAGDGCGGKIASCGTCPSGQICGGGGVPGQCGAPEGGPCAPLTCAQLGVNCGPAGDGCGGLIPSCGVCAPPATCGGGGSPGKCGVVACVPLTCAQLGFNCGPAGDGCGGQLDCGACSGTNSCGGNGIPGVCGGSNPH